ncbi:phage tail tape measure protein [Acinetobacter gerneri]|uniref:phage tail tape measure protein n=1 Tax=Acinetobacter gerneri TaxID=202952 RepID=UPI0029359B8B|nr:phage tail tape measure protein [Acinetobacter gerneri]MDV2438709.1 phage tail tape measure protein [Acinetobacter gerneri]
MSGKNTTVYMTLQIKGNAGQEMKRIADQQVTATTKINQQWTQIGTAQARFVNTARAGAMATQNTARAGDQLLRTNKLIEGVLRNQTSQIKQHADYMKRVEQSSKNTKQNVQQTSSLWQKGTAVAGGLAGGYMTAKMVTANPLERGRNFAATIFDASASINNGFTGMSKEQAKASNIELMEYAKNAVRKGHGTLEGVSESAGILAASGNYEKTSDLKDPLIAIAKSSFAAGATEADMANLAQQTKQFGIAPNRTQAALDRMMSSGFAGGFELKDMAQFLPEVLASATKAGYSGEQGLNTVTTHLQLAKKYTGTAGEAKTNIEDLYGLVNQKHFKDAIAKNISVRAGDPTKIAKKGAQVFDLTQYLVDNQLKGVDTTTSIANLMNRELSYNKEYNKLSKELNNAIQSKNEEQSTRLKQAIELVIAGQFGDIFHNKQSLSGITSIVNGVKNGTYQEIYDKSWNGEGSVERVADIKGESEFAKAQALEQEKILAQIKIYESVNDKLGQFESGLTQIMQNNQGLAAATLAATGALTVLANTAGGAALGKVLAGGTGGAVATGTATATTGVVAKAATGAKAMGLVGLAYAGAQVLEPIDNYFYSKVDKMFGGDGNRPDFLQQYIDKEKAKQSGAEQQAEKTEQLISGQQKQNELSQELSGKLSELINVTSQNKPLPFPSGSLLDMISQRASTEEKRTGAPNVPFYLQKH